MVLGPRVLVYLYRGSLHSDQTAQRVPSLHRFPVTYTAPSYLSRARNLPVSRGTVSPAASWRCPGGHRGRAGVWLHGQVGGLGVGVHNLELASAWRLRHTQKGGNDPTLSDREGGMGRPPLAFSAHPRAPVGVLGSICPDFLCLLLNKLRLPGRSAPFLNFAKANQVCGGPSGAKTSGISYDQTPSSSPGPRAWGSPAAGTLGQPALCLLLRRAAAQGGLYSLPVPCRRFSTGTTAGSARGALFPGVRRSTHPASVRGTLSCEVSRTTAPNARTLTLNRPVPSVTR